MPQTLSFNLVHVVFSTKGRVPLIREEIRPTLHAYLAATARELGCECFHAGGVSDHVHLALKIGMTQAAAKVVSEIKTSSSAWMKTQGAQAFAWQRGYGLFSVSPAHLGELIRYIDGQEAHHRKRDFQGEMREFLEKYHIAFDERYLWIRCAGLSALGCLWSAYLGLRPRLLCRRALGPQWTARMGRLSFRWA